MLWMGTATGYDAGTLSNDTYVYICTGPKSEKYHRSKDCRGLNKCSASIEKITLAKAKELGRGPCGICIK